MPIFERILLGIDPGYTRIGYGLVRERAGKFEPLEWGIIEGQGDDLSAGKRHVASELGTLIRRLKPEAAAVERLYFASNKKSAMAVSEMRGVLMLVLAQHSVPVLELTPLQVKQRVCGHGQADKKQMQKMVAMLLNIHGRIEPDDAADALGLALCAATERTY
ncbi:MAG TPA: crossover junction endodeoxyribonuclease RuvC [Candidatus Paceibacterota bacterium]|nr:crossover junction endodeoxyribonuclease RuvC [Candidatus Paceibacterota bacterium]